MAKKTGLTVWEIADRIGVSVATVSRVARGVGQVSPQMRAKVLAAIEEYNYRPSHLGRALADRKTAALGIVFPGLAGPYYAEVIQGFEAEAVRARQSVLILGTHLLEETANLPLELADRVDGIAIMGGTVSRDIFDALIARGEHVVQLAGLPIPGVPTIRTESAAAVERLTLHLIEDHGYRRISFVGTPTGSPDASARWEGFRAAHRTTGLRVPATPIRVGFEQQHGIAAANQLLDRANPPRAIVCANDEIAVGVLVTLLGKGVRVPEDIAITGFDDIPTAGITSPALTTIRQPMRELGAETARTLLRCVADECDPDLDTILDTELVLRGSCGCTPSATTSSTSPARRRKSRVH